MTNNPELTKERVFTAADIVSAYDAGSYHALDSVIESLDGGVNEEVYTVKSLLTILTSLRDSVTELHLAETGKPLDLTGESVAVNRG